jgi:hypothetical protein
MTNFVYKENRLNYEQLLEVAKFRYKKHNIEQEAFLRLTTTLKCESAHLKFMTLVAFQQALRLLAGNIALRFFYQSSFLVLFKRFLAFPLSQLKDDLRAELLAELYQQGLSNGELLDAINFLERRCRGGLSAIYLLCSSDVRDIIRRVIVISVPFIIKSCGPAWSYDLLSICLPFGLNQLLEMERVTSFLDLLYNKSLNLKDSLFEKTKDLFIFFTYGLE